MKHTLSALSEVNRFLSCVVVWNKRDIELPKLHTPAPSSPIMGSYPHQQLSLQIYGMALDDVKVANHNLMLEDQKALHCSASLKIILDLIFNALWRADESGPTSKVVPTAGFCKSSQT